MGKVAKVLTTAAVLLAVVAAAVVAQSASPPASPSAVGAAPAPTTSKQCYTVPCHGSNNREIIYERIGDGKRDLIRGYGNNDRLHANTYSKDVDQIYGSGGAPTTSTSTTETPSTRPWVPRGNSSQVLTLSALWTLRPRRAAAALG